jgi:hypothetical protein
MKEMAELMKDYEPKFVRAQESIPPGYEAGRAGTITLFQPGEVPSPHILFKNSSTVLDFGFSCTMYMYYFSKLLTSTVYACCVL